MTAWQFIGKHFARTAEDDVFGLEVVNSEIPNLESDEEIRSVQIRNTRQDVAGLWHKLRRVEEKVDLLFAAVKLILLMLAVALLMIGWTVIG